jgi:hypothetical protein
MSPFLLGSAVLKQLIMWVCIRVIFAEIDGQMVSLLRPIPGDQLSLFEHGLGSLLLLVGRVTVFAQDAQNSKRRING